MSGALYSGIVGGTLYGGIESTSWIDKGNHFRRLAWEHVVLVRRSRRRLVAV